MRGGMTASTCPALTAVRWVGAGVLACAAGDSGIGVWVPLAEEAAAVRELLAQAWAVSPGERYRFRTPPALRITTAGLEPSEAEELADAIASLRNPTESTYAG
jgi:DNA-binding transcriptional MocR family regulator